MSAVNLPEMLHDFAKVVRLPKAMGIVLLRMLMLLLKVYAVEETQPMWVEDDLFSFTRGPDLPHWCDQHPLAADPERSFLKGAAAIKAVASRGIPLSTGDIIRVRVRPARLGRTNVYEVQTRLGRTRAVDLRFPGVDSDEFFIRFTSVKHTVGVKHPWMASGTKYDLHWEIVDRTLGVIRATKAPVEDCFLTLRHKAKTPMLTTHVYPEGQETGSVYSSMYCRPGTHRFQQWGTSYLSDSAIPPYSGWSLFMSATNALKPEGTRGHLPWEDFQTGLAKLLAAEKVDCLYTSPKALPSSGDAAGAGSA